jgi:hypothetical protein
MKNKVAHTGAASASNYPTVADGAPIGPRGIEFLRRVRRASGGHVLASNADREACVRALMAAFVRRDHVRDDVVYLTVSGQAFLDMLMRAH